MRNPDSTLPAAQQRLMESIGRVWGRDIQKHRDMVLDAYGPLLALAPKAGIEVTRAHAYGVHPRQVLDIFRPAGARRAPVVVFMHGGAFVRGDKRVTDEVYDNVLYWFARYGYVGVNIEYRLAPEAGWPAGDLGRDVKGLVLISARVKADVLPENPNAAGVRAYFGADESLYETRSPLNHAAASPLPVMIAIAEYENPLLDLYGLELAHRIALVRRSAPRFVRLAGHNHISMVAHFNSGEDFLGREILDFFTQLK